MVTKDNLLCRAKILNLSVSERILLVEDIWDSIAECPEAIQLTDDEKSELDRRFDDFYQNPSAGSQWAIERQRIREHHSF